MNDPPDEALPGDSQLRELFGFDLDDGRWLERVRDSRREIAAGPGRIGDYEILGVVGRGGQGIVYRARQPHTGREIVLKRTSAGVFATEEVRARFAREIEAASALDHPNIVTVYGSEAIDGQLVLAMQWIDGVPFDDWAAGKGGNPSGETRVIEGEVARGSRRSVREVLQVFTRVCDAVQHAHQRGVIHRDLKPSNILVDTADQPHVLDFGLAKLSADWAVERALTHTGVFVGTPAYAAPEVAAGRHGSVDVRVDVYSLGAMLYQALTGFLVFEASLDLSELLQEIQVRDARPPSSLDGVSVITLREVLDEVAADLDQSASIDEPEIEAWIRMAIGNAYAVLGLAASARPQFERALAIRRLLPPGEETELDLAESMEKLGRTCRAMGKLEEAERMLEGALDIRRKWRSAGDGYLAISTNSLGILKRHRGKHAEAESLFLESLEHYRKGLGPEYESIPVVLKNLGLVYLDTNRLDEAVSILREGYERALALHGGRHTDVASCQINLAAALTRLGELEEAGVLCRAAIETLVELHGDRYGMLAVAQERLAEVSRRTGRLDEAESLLLEAFDSHRLADNPTDLVRCLRARAEVLREMGRMEEAEARLREGLSLATSSFDPAHETVALQRAALGSLLVELGCYDEAFPLLLAAQPILAFPSSLGRDSRAQERDDVDRLLAQCASAEADRTRGLR